MSQQTFEEWLREQEYTGCEPTPYRGWHARDEYVKSLEERIERVRALWNKYEGLGNRAWALTGVKRTYQDVADELFAALSEE